MGMLVDGRWTGDWKPADTSSTGGRFERPQSTVRHWITPDGAAGPTGEPGFAAQPDRYHLYVALVCPWASRTLIARRLKGLEALISVSVVDPRLTERGWRFGGYPDATEDHLHGAEYLHEIYTRSEPSFTGRVTVPVLWDKRSDRMVNNESSDILRMLDTAFEGIVPSTTRLRPPELVHEIERWNDRLYERLNNGVYRAGFATTQGAYEEAARGVFEMLDEMEARLAGSRFLVSDVPVETDWRALVTLVRFDLAYHGAFKCNLRRLSDYPRLSAYLARLLEVPGVAETIDLDHIRAGYYSIRAVNPLGIVPIGPAPSAPLDRLARSG